MTTHKHLKARVRSRMTRTGESYAAARANVVAAGADSPADHPAVDHPTVNGIRHFAGLHPETSALRILATHAGLRDESTGRPISEEIALAAGGGLGAGVFAFHYAKEQFSSLYLAGRSSWEDGRPFMEGAARRLGLEPRVVETGSAKAADRDLRAALEAGPVAAWVDSVELGYRAAPAEHSGGGYHVIVVYGIDGDTAIVGDLAAEPIELPIADLARARARIAKQKNRLLSVAAATERGEPPDVAAAALGGLEAGAEALATERRRNFSLAAFEDLARRMHGSSGADSWSRVFPRGRLLWSGLSSLHRFVETYSTGGGLLRPMVSPRHRRIGHDDRQRPSPGRRRTLREPRGSLVRPCRSGTPGRGAPARRDSARPAVHDGELRGAGVRPPPARSRPDGSASRSSRRRPIGTSPCRTRKRRRSSPTWPGGCGSSIQTRCAALAAPGVALVG